MRRGGPKPRRPSIGDRLFLFVLIVVSAGCGLAARGEGQQQKAHSSGVTITPADVDRAFEQLTARLRQQGVEADEPIHPPVSADELLPFLPWVASHCYVDSLGPSPYTHAWQRYHVRRDDLEPGALMPATGELPPAPGSQEAKKLAALLRIEWLADPKSHVVDCRFHVRFRRCRHCLQELRVSTAYYVAYLPAALSRDPKTVRSLLMLVPGGRGGRTRPFLTPVPGKTPWHRGSGGLETKQLVDAYLAEHPDSPPPIVVALESSGGDYNNGRIEHLSHDMPKHMADTYLGVPHQELLIGAEGISSGARAILETLRLKPDAFATAGMTCMACGVINPRKPGLRDEIDFDGWAEAMGKRARAGKLRMRFSIGTRDGQLSCNEGLRELFAEHGVFDGEQATQYRNCNPGYDDDWQQCDADSGGWATYAGEMHHYGLLKKSHAPQLEWHLSALGEVAAARRGGQP